MSDKLLEYRSKIYSNGEIFLLKFKEEFTAFSVTSSYIDKFNSFISTERMITGKSLISLIPYLSIIYRQYCNAFQCLSVFQSYQAWVLLRPAIESILIMGKWIDDRNNVNIWKKQEDDWRNYQKAYSGKKLASQSLPNSEAIQGVLKTINDDFMHANPKYYHRHTEIRRVNAESSYLWLSFFDSEQDHLVHLYSFLHLTLFMLHKVGLMFQPLYQKKTPFEVDLIKLQEVFGNKVRTLAQEDDFNHAILKELGLWPSDLLQSDR